MVCTLTKGGKAACNSLKLCIDNFFFPVLEVQYLLENSGALPPLLVSFKTAFVLPKRERNDKNPFQVAFS